MKPKFYLYVNGKCAGEVSEHDLYSAGVKLLRAACGFREEVLIPNGDKICMSTMLQPHRKPGKVRRHK